MDLGLQNKIALVVAASKGLGYAAARQLAEDGARVVICSRSAERVEAAVARMRADLGPDTAVVGFVADVQNPADIDTLIANTVETYGGLDILITNAGGPPGGTFASTETSEWEKAFELTVMSVTRLLKAALPYLRNSESASVLTVTSISVKQPVTGLMLSNVLRPAVIGLTKNLAHELGPDNIRVNSILPGWTDTERVAEIMAYRSQQSGATVAEERKKVTDSIPLGRIGSPAEFGKVAAFLVSPAASYVSGVMMQVDGASYGGLL